MKDYVIDGAVYVDIKEIKAGYKDYYKGSRSYAQFLKNKNITNFVYGQIVNDEVVVTEKYSRKVGSVFISKDCLSELFERSSLGSYRIMPLSPRTIAAPPIIDNKDLVLFKDDEGHEFRVIMRGERTHDGIFFRAKGVMKVFDMKNLIKVMTMPHTTYKLGDHYVYFSVPMTLLLHKKEMYFTYAGIRKIIETSRIGVAHNFKTWIGKIVFNVIWGTQEQKANTFKKIRYVDAEHLRVIMSKSGTAIFCLYLINVGINDNGKRVFKYGFSDNVQRRFKQHMKRYNDEIALDTFILIPVLDLSKAEANFKNSVSRYKYEKEGEDELITLCDEAYLNIKSIFRTISERYCGNIRAQIIQYEHEIKDLIHHRKLQIRDKDVEIIKLKNELTIKDKDIEILLLKLGIQSH